MKKFFVFRAIPTGMGRPDMGQYDRPVLAPKAGTKSK